MVFSPPSREKDTGQLDTVHHEQDSRTSIAHASNLVSGVRGGDETVSLAIPELESGGGHSAGNEDAEVAETA